MNLLLAFVRKTVVGGLLFLVPVTILAIVIGRIFSALEPITDQFAGQVLGPDALGPVGRLLAVLACLIAASFVAGLLASTIVGQKVMEFLEASLLRRVPGYAMVKNMAAESAANLARIESSSQVKAVYVKSGEGWQLGFVTDKVDEDLYSVFLPDAPTPTSGQLLYLSADNMVESGMSIADAMQALSQLGVSRAQRSNRSRVKQDVEE